jgi:hypothetical protein
MYRNRNLDIFIAGGLGLLGGAAYELHAPGPLQVVLGIALFFAPGYLWSEAILSQRLTGLERATVSGGIALILPILGGFLFYGLKIPLFRSSWVGLLVVLTLLGLVAVAVQRLREVPDDDPRRDQPSRRPKQRSAALSPLNLTVYALAAVVALGAVAFSVKNAEAQKYPAYTELGMTPTQKADARLNVFPTKAVLSVVNGQGVAEQYQLRLSVKGKVTSTFLITLSNGQTWQRTIAYTDHAYSVVASLYLLPDTSKAYRTVTNGIKPPAASKKK